MTPVYYCGDYSLGYVSKVTKASEIWTTDKKQATRYNTPGQAEQAARYANKNLGIVCTVLAVPKAGSQAEKDAEQNPDAEDSPLYPVKLNTDRDKGKKKKNSSDYQYIVLADDRMPQSPKRNFLTPV